LWLRLVRRLKTKLSVLHNILQVYPFFKWHNSKRFGYDCEHTWSATMWL